MSFSFNFASESETAFQEASTLDWYKAVESCALSSKQSNSSNCVSVSLSDLLLPHNKQSVTFHINGICFKRIADVGEHDIDSSSDLIPGVYGGGLKIWECTIDLMKYMIEDAALLPPKTSRVLELGCGHGFPGITAMLLGYQHITFLDLNMEVIRHATWPNIFINSVAPTLCGIECLAGDWLSLAQRCIETGATYDFILSSETIYSVETCQQVTYFLDKCLSANGIALIATKKFYFGVGGGTFEFEKLCADLENLELEIVRSFQDGQSNIRDLILVRRKCIY